MKPCADLVQPPRIAAWLVNLFVPAGEAELILGDLLEEFTQIASRAGVIPAQHWYWRQSVKTISHLTGSAFRTAPLLISAAIVGGLLLRRAVSGLPELAILTAFYRVFENHSFFLFVFAGITIGQVIASMFVGCMVALATKDREMVATMSLGLIFCAITVNKWVWTTSGHHAFSILFQAFWSFADWVGFLMGGVIVRTRRIQRSANTTLSSST